MVSWNFGFVFTNLLLKASGSFSQACRSALGSFSQNAVSTRYSPFAHSLRSRDALRPGFATFLSPPRGVAERRETRGTMTRYPGVLVTRHARRLRGALRLQRETRASRRSTVAILGRGPCFHLRHFLRIRAASSSRPGRSARRTGSRASRGGGYEPPPRDATPRSAHGPSPEDAPRLSEAGGNIGRARCECK